MKKRRILAWALSVSMVVSSFSYQILAQETDVTSEVQNVAEVSVDDEKVVDTVENSDDTVVSSSSVTVEENGTDFTNLMAQEGWISGATNASVVTTGVVEPSDNSVNLKVTGGKGKVSGGEDSIVYYGTEISNDLDFTLSGKITVNDVNASGVSNPNQSGYGIAVLNKVDYDKNNGDAAFTSGAFGTFAMAGKSDAVGYFGLRARTTPEGGAQGASATASADIKSLAKANASGGGDVFDVTLNKTGSVVTLTVNGNSDSYAFDKSEFDGNVYPMFFVARSADITVTDINFTYDQKKVVSLNVKKLPDKTTFLLNEDLDTTGIQVEAAYEDGTTEIIDDFKVTGYDSTTASTQTLTVVRGAAETTFDVVVKPIDLTKVTINNVPYETTYHAGMPFSVKGLDITADFEDGSSQNYKNGENTVITVNGIELKDGELVPSSILALNKDVDVKVTLEESENYIVRDSSYATYKATVSNAAVKSLGIAYKPAKLAYFVGDELDLSGISVVASYEDGYSEVLSDDKYTASGFDSSKTGTNTITLTSVANPLVSTTFDIKVSDKAPSKLYINHYPKTTYFIGESWNDDDLDIVTLYNSGDQIEAVQGVDFTIDKSTLDTSKAGVSYVTIVPTNTDLASIKIDVTTRNREDLQWKSLVFGQSSTGVKSGNAKSEVIENSDGTITVKSWDGSGKITGDHDGIAYYYTRVSANDNFRISADIYVRGYLGTHPGSGAAGYYNLDEKRSGQEAFGIMARDVIPLVGKDGLGNDSGIVVKTDEAEVDENGEPVGKRTGDVFSSNMAIAGGYSGTSWPADPTAASYYKNSNINRINLVARTGVTTYYTDGPGNPGGTKNGPLAISSAFPKAGIHYESTMTKMNGSKEDEAIVGDSYRITLERVNVMSDPTTGAITRRGLKATATYLGPDEDRIGETITQFLSDESVNAIFSAQSEDAYIGFFAARWGIIDVSNIEASVSDPATDQVYNVVEEEPVTPAFSVRSALYTTSTDYTLNCKVNNENGGFLTLKKGDQTLYHQLNIGKKAINIQLTLDADAANTFTAIYKPSTLDNLTTYDDVVSTFTVYHRSPSTSDTIYVSPDGKSEAYIDAAGVSHYAGSSREYPMDFVTSIGFIRPGQKIVMLDGTYKLDKGLTISLENSGTKTGLIKTIQADEGAHPVIDFQGLGTGFYVGGSYWHIRDLEIIHSADQQPGFELGGKFCTVENVKTHDNGGTGFQVSRISSQQEFFEDWPSNNVVKHCETWNNADSTKINADGFGCKLTVGNSNVFDNCVSHHNVDDGWDLYTKLASGAIGETSIVNCATYKMGKKLEADGSDSNWGGGGHNGFKMGGENIYDFHFIKDSISFMNGAAGVTSNSNPALKIRNSVFYKNSGSGISLYSSSPSLYCYDIKGAISFDNGSKDGIGGSLNGGSFVNHSKTDPMAADSNNFFSRGDGNGCTDVAGNKLDPAAMFVSTDFDAATTNGRFSQNADDSFDFKGFLQRKTPYVHDEEDAVVSYGCFNLGNTDETDETTAATTERTTQATTTRHDDDDDSHSSSNGGGGGGSSRKASGTSSNEKALVGTPTERTDRENIKSNLGPDNIGNTTKPSTVSTAAFGDIADRPWAVEAITALSEAGVINGLGNGKFGPDQKAKRCDFLVMLTKLMGIEGTPTSNFDDVPAGAYYANAVGLAKDLGIATGRGDNKFDPTSTISRQDMMVLVARTLEISGVELDKDTSVLDNFADGALVAEYAKPYVAALVNLGIVSGTGNKLEGAADITRAQMAVLLYNVATAATTAPAAEEAAADEVAADEVAADEATADEVAADEATADEVAADEATADEVAADEATAEETTNAQ